VGFVVDRAALGQVFSKYFGFPCQSSFHQILHHHNHPGLAQWPQCRVDPIELHPPLYQLKKRRALVFRTDTLANEGTRVVMWSTACCLFNCFMLVSCVACSSVLKMVATCSSEMSVGFQRNTWSLIPEDRTLHAHLRENLKSYIYIAYIYYLYIADGLFTVQPCF
jgi:hypothetical protein